MCLQDRIWGGLHTRSHLDHSPCHSLSDHPLFYPLSDLLPAPALLLALRSYEAMHRRCVASVEGWEGRLGQARWQLHYASPLPGLGDCRYLVWTDVDVGLGNRLLGLLSAFVYALLSHRALLLHSAHGMEE